jgi:transcriptional regulator with XRE-family HTH domain
MSNGKIKNMLQSLTSEHGFSQTFISQLTGIDCGTISRVSSGKQSDVAYESGVKIADLLHAAQLIKTALCINAQNTEKKFEISKKKA